MDDIFMEFHRQRTKSSMSEAFKDEAYASPITKFHSDWFDVSHYIGRLFVPVTLGITTGVIITTFLLTRG